jgi:hypothetical protein
MPGFVLRVASVAVTLWLAACGAGGNNNIFDLLGTGGGTVLSVSVEAQLPRATPIGSLPPTVAANAGTGPGFELQS